MAIEEEETIRHEDREDREEQLEVETHLEDHFQEEIHSEDQIEEEIPSEDCIREEPIQEADTMHEARTMLEAAHQTQIQTIFNFTGEHAIIRDMICC